MQLFLQKNVIYQKNWKLNTQKKREKKVWHYCFWSELHSFSHQQSRNPNYSHKNIIFPPRRNEPGKITAFLPDDDDDVSSRLNLSTLCCLGWLQLFPPNRSPPHLQRACCHAPLHLTQSHCAVCKKAIWLSGVRGVDSQSKAVASPDGTREERIDNEWLSAARLSARQRFTGPQQTRNRCDCVTGSCTQCSDILLSESCVNSWALSICFQRWRE